MTNDNGGGAAASAAVRVTILMDNEAGDHLAKEHGLSLWIEADGRRILMDTGQSPAFAANADKLGVRVEDADFIVLSHGHYDHAGGLASALRANRRAQVFLHADGVCPKYSIPEGKPAKPVGMPASAMRAIGRLPEDRLRWVSAPVMLTDKIGLTGPIPRHTDFEDTGGPFFLDMERKRADPLTDDQALWIRTDAGIVVCVGCCHSGLINTLDYARKLSGIDTILAVIGGFHLVGASQARMDKTVAALRAALPRSLAPCHCTSAKAVETLKRELGESVIDSVMAGMVWTPAGGPPR